MKCILIYSGGLDSTVLLHKLAKEKKIVEAITIDYGQKHKKEIAFAKKNCRFLGIVHNVVNISKISNLFGSNSLTDRSKKVPHGKYGKKNMSSTVVPNRNMIFISIAVARAMALKCDRVAYAAHSGDHELYADCTEEFANSLDETIKISSSGKVRLFRPFVNMTKKDIVNLGRKLKVDFSQTWSCYEGKKIPCGKCGTCLEREDALRQ